MHTITSERQMREAYALHAQRCEAQKAKMHPQSVAVARSFKSIFAQGFPTNYAQLLVTVFFLGSFIGENVLTPVAEICGKKSIIATTFAVLAGLAILAPHVSNSTVTGVVRFLQIMAALAGVVSLLLSLSGNNQSLPFHELLNPQFALKQVVVILAVGILLGVNSAKIRQSFMSFAARTASVFTGGTKYDAKPVPVTSLDKNRLNVVSSEDYLFSDLCE